jgi:hypothetical protein
MIITCTDHRIIEILGLRPSNRLPVSYYHENGSLMNVKQNILYFHISNKCIFLKSAFFWGRKHLYIIFQVVEIIC